MNSGVFDCGAVGSATAPKMAVPVGLSIDGAAPPAPAAGAGMGGTGGFAMGAGGAIIEPGIAGGSGIAGVDVGMGGAAGKRLAPDCGATGIAGAGMAMGSGIGAGIVVAGGNRLAPDIGSGMVGAAGMASGSGAAGIGGCIIIPPATGGGGSGRSSAGPSVANASIGVCGACLRFLWQRAGPSVEGEAARGGTRWCAAQRTKPQTRRSGFSSLSHSKSPGVFGSSRAGCWTRGSP